MSLTDQIAGGYGRTRPAASRTRSPYNVAIAGSFTSVLKHWSAMADAGAALPFQQGEWLKVWEDTFGRNPHTDVLAATIYDARWAPVMAVPLIRRRAGLKRIITFADEGVADYNAPILSALAPTDRAGAMQVWRALLRALPTADVFRLQRMPLKVGTQPNPLALLAGVRPAPAPGLALSMSGTYANWRAGLPRRYRMELGRCGRLFDALPGARFLRVEGRNDRILAALEDLQRRRIQALGRPYLLDGSTFRGFYRRLAGDSGSGAGVLTALTTDRDIVAVMFGLRYGTRFTMLRIGAADGAYARMSPGRHLITSTIEMLRAEGVDCFDFGLGDYAYKRKLGGTPVELFDLVSARSPLGLPEAAGFHLKSQARRSTRLRTIAARWRPGTLQTAEQTG